MSFFKRIFLFLVVNFLVIAMVSIVLSLFNIQPYLNAYGVDYKELLIFCLVWGMGGALISLSLSRVSAKWMMKIQVIDPHTRDPQQQKLIETVYKLAQKAQLPAMPEVGIYKAADVNAFATGPTRSRALVAVSTGLLEHMNKDQVEAILGHEVTHVANGDMVTMTLLQGVVNAFVMFLSRILAFVLSGFGRGEDKKEGSTGSFILFTYLFQFLFMILGSLIIFWFSRRREYAADYGGATLAGKEKMISALEGLQDYVQKKTIHTPQQEVMQTYKISQPSKSGFAQLFASHPPLELRIKRLKETKFR